MPRRFFKRLAPHHDRVRNHRHLKIFGQRLHDPNLWHFNRRSVSGAMAVGLFIAFVPLPFQMVLAAGAAIAVRVNLPLSVILVWITNPVTIPPIFYFAYRIGAWILGRQPKIVAFEASFNWFMEEIAQVWQPLLLGSLVCGLTSAVLGFCVTRMLWRWHVLKHLQRRRARRRAEAP